jgi:steroid 5-alpha reductase family enzyme
VDGVLHTYFAAAAAVFIYMTLWYLVAIATRRNDLADVAWGLGFVVLAWLGVATAGVAPRPVLIAALVTAWGVRLATHIWSRNRARGEDFRYAAWRKAWGRAFWVRSYLQVFLLQGFFMLLVAAPIIVVGADPGPPLGWLDGAGAVVSVAGIVFEALADAQLRRFRSDPSNKGRILQNGLWGYSRHPNYFGETVFWTGLALVALSSSAGALGLIGPAAITVLLIRVSGIPMLERHHAGEPEFEAYRRRVSAFVPLPPRKEG